MAGSARLRARAGLAAVSGGALLWGTTGVAVTIVHDRSGLDAVPIGLLRLVIAALVLAAWFRGSGPRRVRASFAEHRWALVAAGAGLGAYQALYFIGVQEVGVSVSTLVSLGVAPIVLTVAAALTHRRLPTPLAAVTIVAAVVGLALISLRPGAAHAPHPLVGLLASVGSGLGYAATTVVNRRLAPGGDPLLLTGMTAAIGAVVLVPFALPSGVWWPSDATAGAWLLYIGVVPTVFAYGLFYLGLRSVPTEVAGVLTLLEPLAAALLAVLVLHETLTGSGVVGATLLLAAIAGMYARAPQSPAVAVATGALDE